MNFEEIVSYFTVKTRSNDRVQAICPCHSDKKASLSISRGNKGVVLKCHAGCDNKDIVKNVGLRMSDLFNDSRPPRQSKPSWMRYIESREQKKIEAVYQYHSILNGYYSFTKLRLTGKKILYGKLQSERFTYGLGHDTPRKSYKAIYGNFQTIKQAIKDGRTVFIPEGEKDVDNLVKYGYVAFTYGGVNDWQEDFKNVVVDANVIVLADNDIAGKKAAEQIKMDVQDVVKSVKIIVPVPDTPKADISDYFETHSKEDFERLIKTDVKEESKDSSTKNEVQKIVSRLIELDAVNRYSQTDRGSGDLFADIFRDKHRYNPSWKDFAYYDGRVWTRDTEGMRARQDAKKLVDALIRYMSMVSMNEEQQTSYIKYVGGLSQLKNRNAMLTDSRDRYCFYADELDRDSYLLNVQNCVLNLSGNEVKKMEHSPDMMLSKIANVKYNPAADCPLWKKTLNEIMQNDREKIRYLQKIFGMSLTGCTREEQLFIFYGASTRNGKSTILETFSYLLGDYSCTMQPETLAVKANKDSRQASGDIARLAGVRFVNVAEPCKSLVLDVSQIKQLTGNDTITARHLHEREFEFSVQFKLIINTNFLPKVLDDTVFESGRMNVIPFLRHFEPDEQDRTLKQRLKQDQELSGILNWAIEGWQTYKREGLTSPDSVKAATSDYKEQSDKIGSFINEMLEKTGRNSKAKEIYDKYAEWCNDNGYGTENKSNFFSELKRKGVFASSGTVAGKTVRNVVKGYELAFLEADGDTPFN